MSSKRQSHRTIVGVDDGGVGHSKLLGKRESRGRLIDDVDSDKHDIVVQEFLVERFEIGSFESTRRAPRVPKVHDHHLAWVIGARENPTRVEGSLKFDGRSSGVRCDHGESAIA